MRLRMFITLFEKVVSYLKRKSLAEKNYENRLIKRSKN